MTIVRHLSYGYLPKEMPPCFSSTSLGRLYRLSPADVNASMNGNRTAQVYIYNLARPGGLRRHIGVPNPTTFVPLCVELIQSSAEITPILDASPYIQSRPIQDPEDIRSLISRKSYSELTDIRVQHRSSARYILIADVSNCYRSIYTHSIPWALHGKVVAKQDRTMALAGNRIDRLVRQNQDQQTIGIPIGPDTSLLIAEAVLSAIDTQVNQSFPDIRGFRYYDDYEFVFSSADSAGRVLAGLQQALQDFELELNPTKTEIYSLPLPLEKSWASHLRTFNFPETEIAQRHAIIRFFDLAFELHKKVPREHVIGYVSPRLERLELQNANYSLVQNLLLQCCIAEPAVLRDVLRLLLLHREKGFPVDRDLLREMLLHIIYGSAPLGHASEVAWCLWAFCAFGFQLDQKAADSLVRIADSAVAILALDAHRRGLFPNGISPVAWEPFLNSDELYGPQWLLAYEASFHNLCPAPSGVDYVAADEAFDFLRNAGVSFFAPIAAFPTSAEIRVRKTRTEGYD